MDKNLYFIENYEKDKTIKNYVIQMRYSSLTNIKFYGCIFKDIQVDNTIKNSIFYNCNFNKLELECLNLLSCFFYRCSFIRVKIFKYVTIENCIFKMCRFDLSEGFIKLVDSKSCTFFGAK